MTTLDIYQVDAFTDTVFGGNPAAVVPLPEWLPDDVLLKIAQENNLSETAYILEDGDNAFIRWFTPSYEVDLCGHATLASAYVYLNILYPGRDNIIFKSRQAGDLTVTQNEKGLTLDFPARPPTSIDADTVDQDILKAVSSEMPIETYKARDLLLIYDSAETVRKIQPDFNMLTKSKRWVSVSAKSDDPRYDFISRFFCPDDTVLEDPVTGSAHCTLIPYWAEKLGKDKLTAYQASARGGVLKCELQEDRVLMTGRAALYMKGQIYV